MKIYFLDLNLKFYKIFQNFRNLEHLFFFYSIEKLSI